MGGHTGEGEAREQGEDLVRWGEEEWRFWRKQGDTKKEPGSYWTECYLVTEATEELSDLLEVTQLEPREAGDRVTGQPDHVKSWEEEGHCPALAPLLT